MTNLTMDEPQKEALFAAIWENFEHFEIITYMTNDESVPTFMTQKKQRKFSEENFIKAYSEGHMDIEDLVTIMF